MTILNPDRPSDCGDPIDPAVLTDYWLAALPGPEEQAVEEHLLACDLCGERLRELIAIAQGVGSLARDGSLRLIVSEAFVECAAENGLRVRAYAPPPGGSVECTVEAADDLLIARLAADLRGAGRVDLSICDGEGVEQLRLPDIPYDSRARSVIYQESIRFAKDLPDARMLARLVTFDESGRERLLGEYAFNHTRSLP